MKYHDLRHELAYSEPYRKLFIQMVREFSETNLTDIVIERIEVGQHKKLGDYLNRIAYHESVHAGQMLGYLRKLDLPRPNIWD